MATTAPASLSPVDVDAADTGTDYRAPFAIVTTLFFMWGGITALNDIVIPHLKSIFQLSYAQAMLVQFAFFSGYFIFALPAGRLIEAVGYKGAMVSGLCVMAVGTLGFIPAAMVPSFGLFLAALLVLAAGMTILQVSANPYVSVLGPPRTASSRLNLSQALNSLGTTVFPYVGGVLILGAAAVATSGQVKAMSPADLHHYQVSQAASIRMPYLVLTGALILLAALIGLAKLPVIAALQGAPTDDAKTSPVASSDRPGSTLEYRAPEPVAHRSVWAQRQLVLGAIGIFAYVGAEVAIGSFLINYFATPVKDGGIIGIPEVSAAKYVSVYWFGAMVGRFIGSALLQKVNPSKLLAGFAVVAIALVALTMVTTGHVAMYAVLAVGLFNSIMFPNIFTLGIEGLGNLTSKGSSILIAAIVGGAIIPEVQGKIADVVGVHHAFILPLVCYAYIAFFAVDRWRHPIVAIAPVTVSA